MKTLDLMATSWEKWLRSWKVLFILDKCNQTGEIIISMSMILLKWRYLQLPGTRNQSLMQWLQTWHAQSAAAIFDIPQNTESYCIAYTGNVTPESLNIALVPDVVMQICHLVREPEAGGVEF